MISCPDLRPHFRHVEWRAMPYSGGALVGSDFRDKAEKDPVFGVFRQCGFWTVDEVAILFRAAQKIQGYWLDIGGLTGWTAAHLAAAGCHVASLDPMYANPDFRARAVENLTNCGVAQKVGLWAGTSSELLGRTARLWSGIVIDGAHESPCPLQDAIAASTRVADGGAILLHDANLASVQRGYQYLEDNGWRTRLYRTVHGVAVCYRDGFVPLEAA